MAVSTGSGVDQRSVGTFSLPCFNRLVRTRMLGGVGRAGVIPALTRLGFVLTAWISVGQPDQALSKLFAEIS